jgi:hypothetical protein
MPAVVIEPTVENPILGPNHEPQPSATTSAVEEIPPTSKDKKRKTSTYVFTLPRKITRSTKSTTTTITTPTIKTNTSTSSPVEPDTPQNILVAAKKCPDFADA